MKWGKILNYFTIKELELIKSFPSCYEKALAIVGRVYAEKLDEKGFCVKKGKRDNSGNAETYHLQSVSNMASTYDGKIVGLLHDIVEDHYIDLSDLVQMGFSFEIIMAINILSRDKSIYPNYSDYITSIINSKNPLAIECKFHDMLNNLAPKRIIYLPWKRQEKLLKKYGTEFERMVLAYEEIKEFRLVRKKEKKIC